jgi:hypothetical protein
LSTSAFKKFISDPKDKYAGTAKEYEDDPISMMMIAEGLKQKIIAWPEPFKENGYHMITFTKPKPKPKKKDDEDDDKKDKEKDKDKKKKDDEEVEMTKPVIEVTFLGTNWPAALKKFENATKDDFTEGIVLHSNLNWQRESGKKTKSGQFLDAYKAVAKFMFDKKSNNGVLLNEDQAKFDMQWHKDKKIEEKMKLIDEQFKGDGGLLHQNVVWHIWSFHPVRGDVTKVQNYNNRKMPDAYSHFVKVVKQRLERKVKDWDEDFLLVANNTPMLSTTEWKSPINKIMVGKAAAYRDILIRKTLINDHLRHGKDYQYFAILKDKSSGLVKQEPMGTNGNEATKKFDEKTRGAKATHTGILYHANGNIYRIAPADPKNAKDPVHKGENDALVAFTEYFFKVKKMFTGPIKSEKEAGIILESEHKAHLAEVASKRKEIAQRIIAYGDDLKQNFNGTGWRFLKQEHFRAVRYNLETGAINYWNIYAWNMDNAYDQFG